MRIYPTLLLCAIALAQNSSAGKIWEVAEDLEDWRNHQMTPPKAKDHEGSFWLGTQNLLCVLTVETLHRLKRSTRNPMTLYHTIVWYRGTIFEWGTGKHFFHIGKIPASRDCRVRWEEKPHGYSNCSKGIISNFTVNYSKGFGLYSMVSNNCHNFANRVADILKSPNCEVPEAPWNNYASFFWQFYDSIIENFEGRNFTMPNFNMAMPDFAVPMKYIKKLLGLEKEVKEEENLILN